MAVADALDESQRVQAALRKEYEVYLDIASFSSRLYFTCREFSKYDVLYSLSVNAFGRLFLASLQTTQVLLPT